MIRIQLRGPVGLAILLLLPRPALAADVAYYGIVKSQQYEQTLTAAPALLASNAFGFDAFVVASTNMPVVVTNATVKPPNVTPTRNLLPAADGVAWLFNESFNTQAELDATYPTGSLFSQYNLRMFTVNDGTRSAGLNFFGIGQPVVARITNLLAAQTIDTTTEFTLRWDYLGGNLLDIVQVLVFDASSNIVFATPAPLQTNALTGSSTSAVIPAYTLPPGTNLNGALIVARPSLPNLIAYPGASGFAALARATRFPMGTQPAPAPPRLEAVAAPGLPFTLRFTGETNRVYRLQASTNWWSWVDLLITNSATGTGTLTDLQSSNFLWRFYRLQVVP